MSDLSPKAAFGDESGSSLLTVAPAALPLDGKVAIVTGGARGIGWGIVQALAQAGASVVIDDICFDDADALVARISDFGRTAVVAPFDVADVGQHERILELAMDTFGRVDLLVNNAGENIREAFLDVSAEQWNHIVGLNLMAPYFLAQRVAREMIRNGFGGRIINIASVHDSVAAMNSSVYAISKGGLRMLTKALALELAPHAINVNAISPGTVVVERNRAILTEMSPFSAAQMARIPLRRFAEPNDIAGVAVFLAGPASRYMTGHTLYVDGGIVLE